MNNAPSFRVHLDSYTDSSLLLLIEIVYCHYKHKEPQVESFRSLLLYTVDPCRGLLSSSQMWNHSHPMGCMGHLHGPLFAKC